MVLNSISSFFSSNNSKTFRPKKVPKKGTKSEELLQQAQATLGSGDLREAVKVPQGEDENSWLAVNCVDFFNMTNLLYGSVVEFCTNQTCPSMTAGAQVEYLWADGVKHKKPIRCSALQYVDLLMEYIESKLNDPKIFPPDADNDFPKDFKLEVKTIFKRLFRVYAHIYHSHFEDIRQLGEEAHLNTAFKHFCMFSIEFKLISRKEMVPMKETIINLLGEQYRHKVEKKKKK